MATGALYRVPFRRRRSGRTDFRARRTLLLSRKPRFILRRSNRYIRAQVVAFEPSGDRTIVSVDSRQLSSFGWDRGSKNLPAAYLTGFLCGKRALSSNITEGVLDIGLMKAQRGGRLGAAVQGLLDSGVAIPHGEGFVPSKERLEGAHLGEGVPGLVESVKKSMEKV